VPYSNQGQAVSDAVAGHVPMIIYTVALLPHIRSGRLKAIAVTSEERQKQLPDIGTAIEQGVPGVVANSWFGLVGPAGITDAVRDRLYAALAEALSQSDIQTKLIDTGLQPNPLPAAQFRAFIERDTQTWREVAKAAGIKPE
jgi:tripartite-type tricarboxylate transporter receptor subunit TctC